MNSFSAALRHVTAAVMLAAVTQACSNVGSLEGTTMPASPTLRMYPPSAGTPMESLALLAGQRVPGLRATANLQPRMAAEAKNDALLYVSDPGTDFVDVFRWPDGKPIGTLADGFEYPQGVCSDQKGDVWITDTTTSRIIEYAHGGRLPIKTLVEGSGAQPLSCSVDPRTGDLAVANICSDSLTYFGYCPSHYGNVAIYRRARGRAHLFTSSTIEYPYFCSYDARSNLFFDGRTSTDSVALNELKKDGAEPKNIHLSQTIGFPGGVQWRKTYLAVGDQVNNAVYQFHIANGSATTIRATTLDAKDVVGFFIEGATLIGPDYGARWTGLWDYPRGGSPVKTLPYESAPESAVISKAP